MSRIDDIKKIDIVSYLQSQGHEVHHHQGNKAWFWSPIREESGKPSFVVFTNDNKWKDYGSSLPRGDIIDLVQEIEIV